MKTKLLLFALLLMGVSAGAQNSVSISDDCSKNGVSKIVVITGSATVSSTSGRTSCEWVQLWENGPKWATFNVGATITDYANLQVGADATSYYNYQDQAPYYNTANCGGLYAWNQPNYNGRQTTWPSSIRTGVADVATTLWGSNWKTPTRQQLDTLQKSSYGKTTWTWCDGSTTQYVLGCTLKGYKVSGVGAYANKSIFLPAAGYFYYSDGTVSSASYDGYYWSSMMSSSYAYYLYFNSSNRYMYDNTRLYGRSVRAVLDETNSTTVGIGSSQDKILTLYAEGCNNPNTFTCSLGQQLSVSAVASLPGNYFVRWSDGSTSSTRTITMNSNKTLTAYFSDLYTITLGSAGNGVVSNDTTVHYNSSIQISATPDYGYKFSRWNDGNTSNPRTVTVTADKTYTATFVKRNFKLTVNSSDTKQGTVSGSGSYEYQSERTITATPEYGYHFDSWSDGNTENPRVVTLLSDTTITAFFALDKEGECGESLTWQYSEGVLHIMGTGNMDDYENTPVPWVHLIDSIQTIVIDNGVTSIGGRAFIGCSGLTSITIPESVEHIGKSICSSCENLDSIVWNAKSITGEDYHEGNNYYSPFYGASKVTSFVFGPNVDTIPAFVCYGMPITSIVIPDSVTTIEFCAFRNCSGLTSITIPENVTSIGDYAFEGCTELKTVINNSPKLNIIRGSSSNGYVAYYADHAYNGVQVGDFIIKNDTILVGYIGTSTEVVIPTEVTHIGEGAFKGCSELTSITIPESVTSIEYEAFSGCRSLTSIAIPSSVTIIGLDAFKGCTGLTSVHITDIADWCGIKFVLGERMECANPLYFAHHLFLNGQEVTNLTIPNGVTSIEAAFYNCSSLTSVSIPNSVTSIGYYAFRNCSGLTSVTIPNSVAWIGDCAFQNCSGLTSVSIGNSVTNIGWYAFSGCIGLTSVIVPNSVTNIGSYGFQNCSNLTTVLLGSGLTYIAQGFSGCSKLRYITCLAEYPPTVYGDAFPSYNAILKVPCDVMIFYQGDDIWGQFKYIQCIEAEEAVVTTTTVVPAETDATFAWPTSEGANTYTLKITKDGVVFCVLTFNANGQLLNIAFAPGRDGAAHAPEAELTATGYQFTVTGLESGSTYAYTLDAKDAGNNVVANYTGTFTTTGGEMGVESVNKYVNTPTKVVRDGQVLIQRGDRLFDLRGQEVK